MNEGWPCNWQQQQVKVSERFKDWLNSPKTNFNQLNCLKLLNLFWRARPRPLIPSGTVVGGARDVGDTQAPVISRWQKLWTCERKWLAENYSAHRPCLVDYTINCEKTNCLLVGLSRSANSMCCPIAVEPYSMPPVPSSSSILVLLIVFRTILARPRWCPSCRCFLLQLNAHWLWFQLVPSQQRATYRKLKWKRKIK